MDEAREVGNRTRQGRMRAGFTPREFQARELSNQATLLRQCEQLCAGRRVAGAPE